MNTVNKIINISILFLFVAISSISCVDRVGDNEFNIINDGSTETKDATVEVAKGHLQEAMFRIHDSREHKYQYQFNLHIDNYAGYLVVANSLQGRLPRTMSPNADFQTGPRANFLWVSQLVVPVINGAEDLKRPEMGAIASIIFNFSASELVDVHGPMPYDDFKKLKNEPPLVYEKVSVVYDKIIKDLTKQVEILKSLTLSEEAKSDLKQYDFIAGGEIENWIRFANSIRMRMAMRMVKVDPIRAQKEFESAFNEGKYIEDDIELNNQTRHPLYVISNDWYDSRLNANFENLLKRLHHPGLAKWFSPLNPNLKKDINGKSVSVSGEVFAGMRAGMATYKKEDAIFSDSYSNFSTVNSSFATRHISIMKACEVQFLLAEAALRGWNVGGTAKAYYQKGIVKSFEKEVFGSPATYIRQTKEDTPRVDYVDYYNPQYSSPAIDNGSEILPVSWDESFDNEKKLEMIITQKYIANYPLSLESWSEYRRTGYPVMISNYKEDSGDGSIPPFGWNAPNGIVQPDYSIHRIPFVNNDPQLLPDITSSGIPNLTAEDNSMFKGYDVQAAHLWWDVAGKKNF